MGQGTVTLVDAVGGDSSVGVATLGLQAVLIGVIGYGAAIGNSRLLINGVLALPIVFSPALLEWRYDHEVDPRLSLWITVAAVVHVAGFLGVYDIQSGLLAWYDQVAHALSASFVAGVAYAVIVALDRSSPRIRFPDEFRFVFTLSFILAFGVAWEIVEFAAGGLSSMFIGEEALIQYGKDDIVFDLLFNTLAAALVALWGTGYFGDIAAIFAGRLSGSEKR